MQNQIVADRMIEENQNLCFSVSSCQDSHVLSGAKYAQFEGFLHGDNLRKRLNDRNDKISDREKRIENEVRRIRSVT